jgi:hypothetical protein
MVDRRYDSPGERMIGDIRSGEIDAGCLWGPIAGYFAARRRRSLVVPLLQGGGRRAWPIASPSACARRGRLEAQLNAVIAKRQGDLDAVLLQFGVPL